MLKWIASGVMALGLVSLPAAVPVAQAHEWEEHHHEREYEHHRHHECFEVLYRPCCDAPWSCYGRFDCREEAEHAEHFLRRQGFEAFVRR